jgi:hypothetical protein
MPGHPAWERPFYEAISSYKSRQAGFAWAINRVFHARGQCLMFFSR